MKIKRIILMVALIISVASVQAQKSQVIAHRGYWKTAGSAQNSITALQKADSIHCYLALTAMILGTQLFLAGFLGELISRNSSERNNYQIETEFK
jgi:hypothetical protein